MQQQQQLTSSLVQIFSLATIMKLVSSLVGGGLVFQGKEPRKRKGSLMTQPREYWHKLAAQIIEEDPSADPDYINLLLSEATRPLPLFPGEVTLERRKSARDTLRDMAISAGIAALPPEYPPGKAGELARSLSAEIDDKRRAAHDYLKFGRVAKELGLYDAHGVLDGIAKKEIEDARKLEDIVAIICAM